MDRARSIFTAARLGARRASFVALVALLVTLAAGLVGAPAAHAATGRTQADPLSPLRVFISVVPVTPAPFVVLHEDERAHLDALTCERPAAAGGPLDALRQAASSRTAPGGH
jgi:hypothetical protein